MTLRLAHSTKYGHLQFGRTYPGIFTCVTLLTMHCFIFGGSCLFVIFFSVLSTMELAESSPPGGSFNGWSRCTIVSDFVEGRSPRGVSCFRGCDIGIISTYGYINNELFDEYDLFESFTVFF